MMQSLRVKAFLTMAFAALPPPFPGIMCSARAPKARTDATVPSARVESTQLLR
jgi:hypothetical protein